MRPGRLRYVRDRAVVSSWASRHMMLTGLVILAFLLFHLAHFTLGVVDKGHYDQHDVYRMSIAAYKTAWITVTYLVAQFVAVPASVARRVELVSVARLLSSALQLLLQMLRAVFRTLILVGNARSRWV